MVRAAARPARAIATPVHNARKRKAPALLLPSPTSKSVLSRLVAATSHDSVAAPDTEFNDTAVSASQLVFADAATANSLATITPVATVDLVSQVLLWRLICFCPQTRRDKIGEHMR